MRFTAVALACVFAGSTACSSDSNGPDGGITLTSQQTVALTNALVSTGALGTEAAAFAPLVVSQLREAGTMGDYTAVGVQIKFDISFAGTTESGVMSSVVGWQGLNTSTQTVDKAISVAQFTTGTSFPTTGNVAFGSDDSFGTYYDRTTSSSYLATTGNFNLTSASFGGRTTSCNQTVNGVTIGCSYATGTMSGEFGFDATQFEGTGNGAFTQPSTSFNLPAVRFTISISQ